jgi:hypothetical protein
VHWNEAAVLHCTTPKQEFPTQHTADTQSAYPTLCYKLPYLLSSSAPAVPPFYLPPSCTARQCCATPTGTLPKSLLISNSACVSPRNANAWATPAMERYANSLWQPKPIQRPSIKGEPIWDSTLTDSHVNPKSSSRRISQRRYKRNKKTKIKKQSISCKKTLIQKLNLAKQRCQFNFGFYSDPQHTLQKISTSKSQKRIHHCMLNPATSLFITSVSIINSLLVQGNC